MKANFTKCRASRSAIAGRWVFALLLALECLVPQIARGVSVSEDYDSEDFLRTHPLECLGRLGGAGQWVAIKDRIYLFQANQLIVLDLTGPAVRECKRMFVRGPIEFFAVKSPALYLSVGDFSSPRYESTILILDISDIDEPRQVGGVGQRGSPSQLTLNSRYLIEGSEFWRFAPQLKLERVQEIEIRDGSVSDIKWDNQLGYICTAAPAVESFPNSLTDSSSTMSARLAPWLGPEKPGRFTIKDDLCALTSDTAICLVDVSVTSQPRKLSSVELGTEVLDLDFLADYVYASCVDGSLYVLSLEDVLHPRVAQMIPLGAVGFRITALDDRAFVAITRRWDDSAQYDDESFLGSEIVGLDCSNPSNPVVTGRIAVPCMDILMSGTTIYAASGKVVAIDASDLTKLEVKGTPVDPALLDTDQWDVNFGSYPCTKLVRDDLLMIDNTMLGLSVQCRHEAKDNAFGCINVFQIASDGIPEHQVDICGPQFRGLWSDGQSVYTRTAYSNTGMSMNILMQATLDNQSQLVPLGGSLDFGSISDVEFSQNSILVTDEYGLSIFRKK